MGRKDARATAMHCLYQMDIHEKYTNNQLIRSVDNSALNSADKEYAVSIGKNYLRNTVEVDNVINKYLKDDWKIDRISKIELAILRIAITEILYIEDVPNSVAVNEAVELAKEYSDEGSSSFINGLLGAWLRSEQTDE